MRSCHTTDERLFAFVDGEEQSLDEHVETCGECQAFLAELWSGELREDLAEPVMRTLRFEEFLRDVAKLSIDVVAAMGKAFVQLAGGGSEDD